MALIVMGEVEDIDRAKDAFRKT